MAGCCGKRKLKPPGPAPSCPKCSFPTRFIKQWDIKADKKDFGWLCLNSKCRHVTVVKIADPNSVIGDFR